MVTVAEIAKEAFDSGAAEFSDAIQLASLTRTTQGAYDPVSGTYPETTEAFICRAVFADEKAMADAFPAYVIGPADRMVYVEGLATIPVENDAMTIGSQSVVIMRVGDIVGVGTFFSLIVRNT